jgi:hypothetical protein
MRYFYAFSLSSPTIITLCKNMSIDSLLIQFLTLMLVNQLSLSEIKELYGTRHIGRDQARHLVGLMDVFCFSEVHLDSSEP